MLPAGEFPALQAGGEDEVIVQQRDDPPSMLRVQTGDGGSVVLVWRSRGARGSWALGPDEARALYDDLLGSAFGSMGEHVRAVEGDSVRLLQASDGVCTLVLTSRPCSVTVVLADGERRRLAGALYRLACWSRPGDLQMVPAWE